MHVTSDLYPIVVLTLHLLGNVLNSHRVVHVQPRIHSIKCVLAYGPGG